MDAVATWALAMTAPNIEHRVAAIFSQLKYEHHLFCHRVRSVNRGRVVERLRPAFPRYIFINMISLSWHRVLEIAGVSRFVCGYESGPIVVPSAIIEELVARQMDGALPNPLASRFRFGDKVRVVGEQTFIFGNIGIYQYPVAPDRAFILLPWFDGAWSRTEIDERDIEPLAESRRDRGRRRRGGKRRLSNNQGLFAGRV